MSDKTWKLKEGVTLEAEEVAKIACALKSLAIYTSLACENEDNPKVNATLVTANCVVYVIFIAVFAMQLGDVAHTIVK